MIDYVEQERVRALVRRLDRDRHLAERKLANEKALSRNMLREGICRVVTWENGRTTVTRTTQARAVGNSQFIGGMDDIPTGGWL